MNQLLRDKNQRLEESVKFDEQHMDMAVKLKAVEYIIKTESYSVKTHLNIYKKPLLPFLQLIQAP